MILFDREAWREVAHTIGANKRKSIVTAFGVFWGIFMLIVLLSLSNGFRNGIDITMSGVAKSMSILYNAPTSLAYDGLPAGRSWQLYHKDLEQIKAHFPEIKEVSGSITLWEDTAGVSAEGKKDDAHLVAVDESFFDIILARLLAGRYLRDTDHKELRKYCLIGRGVAVKLFGSTGQALGKSLRTSYGNYTVVGVIEQVNNMINIGPSMHRCVYLPYLTVEKNLKPAGIIEEAPMTFHEGVDRKKTMKQIETLVKSMKRISPEDKKAVGFFDIEDILGVFEGINLGLDILVWIVGIGTLLTGIVGISNILLVTVRERTQEIGVRRALGAKPMDIIVQLLMESITLTTLAGLLGIVLGVGLMAMIAPSFRGDGNFPFANPMVDISVALLALTIIIIGGIIAGLIPAIKAVEVKAIEAIREE